MPSMPDLPPPDRQLPQLLAWLVAEPADDCDTDLSTLHAHAGAAGALLSGGGKVPSELSGLFYARARDVSDRFRPRLLAYSLPLPHSLHEGVMTLVEALLGVVSFQAALLERDVSAAPEARAETLDQAMRLLAETALVSAMGGIEPPAALWRLANHLFRDLGQSGEGIALPNDPAGEAGRLASALAHYKRLIAISVLQPESMTARELSWLFDYLDVVAGAAELSSRPIQPVSAVFWIDLTSAGPPVAQIRKAPRLGDELIYFRALGLARRAGEQIDWLETRIGEAEVVGLERDDDLLEPETSGLPLGLTPVEVLSMLRRMRDGWTMPASRSLPRRPKGYTVQVCQGLREIWRMHRSGVAAKPITEWRVHNESPGGYAIISVGGVEGVLSAGMALALRRGLGEPWTICIVRWLRNDKADEVELGLQVVAEGCIAVSVGFRGGMPAAPVPALLLPPHGERRSQAIIVPAGSCGSRRFVLLREGEHLYVAQGRVLSLDMQTANIELFQFEIDPYPI